ncbi:hypothetical protein BDN70DRAFT_926008 [Pholiota conissans]|uniref:Uncharacterized protein n=1 Tax=Pholiota conissans TaxID=109636 RepID=A0A9P5YMA6_9AGAR|nr:hypothetical protein BDN70DRAFT_926008 [Pholiota conissans]
MMHLVVAPLDRNSLSAYDLFYSMCSRSRTHLERRSDRSLTNTSGARTSPKSGDSQALLPPFIASMFPGTVFLKSNAPLVPLNTHPGARLGDRRFFANLMGCMSGEAWLGSGLEPAGELHTPGARPLALFTNGRLIGTIPADLKFRSIHTLVLVDVCHSINIVHYKEAPLRVLLSQALRRLDSLKVLHFRMLGGHPAAELLLSAPFQLKRLHWTNHSEGSTMTAVLAEQQHLRYLYLESRRDTTLPLTCCPTLKELSGNRVTLEALLPGRHIEDLASSRISEHSFGNTLCVHFELVVDYLGRLEKLELVGLLSDELLLLKRLPPLQHLIFSFKWGSRYLQPIPVDFSECQRLVKELFACCPNLKDMDIAYEWTTVADVWFQQWARGSKDGDKGGKGDG